MFSFFQPPVPEKSFKVPFPQSLSFLGKKASGYTTLVSVMCHTGTTNTMVFAFHIGTGAGSFIQASHIHPSLFLLV
jgi:hypothetical protein